jgi:hypothetical protein
MVASKHKKAKFFEHKREKNNFFLNFTVFPFSDINVEEHFIPGTPET